jgi:hypothetical protein
VCVLCAPKRAHIFSPPNTTLSHSHIQLPHLVSFRYAPLAGQASIHSDRTNARVLKRLLKELQPHIARVRYGYEGEMDEEGRMHGKGR